MNRSSEQKSTSQRFWGRISDHVLELIPYDYQKKFLTFVPNDAGIISEDEGKFATIREGHNYRLLNVAQSFFEQPFSVG
jgi:hypothetical protein